MAQHRGGKHAKDFGKKDAGRRPERKAAAGAETIRLYGIHAAEAALANPKRKIRAIYATPNAAQRLALASMPGRAPLHAVAPRDLDRMLGAEAVHQGILLEADPLPETDIGALQDARLVVVLDQVTDPHNVGAVLRSAAAFGVEALIMTARHSPPLAGALAKAASGGLEHIPVVLVPNLARALAELGEIGFMRVGLDSDSDGWFEDLPAPAQLAVVLGAEDRGLRRLTAELCDTVRALSTAGPIRSLNVSNAAAIALHSAHVKMKNRPEG